MAKDYRSRQDYVESAAAALERCTAHLVGPALQGVLRLAVRGVLLG